MRIAKGRAVSPLDFIMKTIINFNQLEILSPPQSIFYFSYLSCDGSRRILIGAGRGSGRLYSP